MLKRLDRALGQINPAQQLPWWLGPIILVVTAVGAISLSLVFAPGEHERVLLFGRPWGEPCAFLALTGQPCPQCGMTRSWVHAVRLDVIRSFWYNPAGATAFWTIVLGGAIGAARLITRRPRALRINNVMLVLWALTWMVGLYAGGWITRVSFGWNPLPQDYAVSR